MSFRFGNTTGYHECVRGGLCVPDMHERFATFESIFRLGVEVVISRRCSRSTGIIFRRVSVVGAKSRRGPVIQLDSAFTRGLRRCRDLNIALINRPLSVVRVYLKPPFRAVDTTRVKHSDERARWGSRTLSS